MTFEKIVEDEPRLMSYDLIDDNISLVVLKMNELHLELQLPMSCTK